MHHVDLNGNLKVIMMDLLMLNDKQEGVNLVEIILIIQTKNDFHQLNEMLEPVD